MHWRSSGERQRIRAINSTRTVRDGQHRKALGNFGIWVKDGRYSGFVREYATEGSGLERMGMGREVEPRSLGKCLRARTARIWDVGMLRAFSTTLQYVCVSSPIPGEGDAFIAARLSGSVYVQQNASAVLSYSGDFSPS